MYWRAHKPATLTSIQHTVPTPLKFWQISLPYLNQVPMGGKLCPPHYYLPTPWILRPSYGPEYYILLFHGEYF